MTVFYRGRYALVTHNVFEVRFPVSKSFPIGELRSIQIVQADVTQPAGRQGAVATGAIILGTGAVPATVLAWQLTGSASYVVAGFLVAAASVAIGCMRPHRHQPFELQAVFRGRRVCLLRTTDERELGQVSRALVRVVEQVGARR